MGSRFIDLEPWDVDDEEYFDSGAVGSTTICRALGKDGPSEKTGDLGNAKHIAILQPAVFEQRVATPPEDCRVGSGEGQRTRLKNWKEANEDRLIITPSEYEDVIDTRNSLRDKRILSWLRSDGVQFEQSYRCRDRETGLAIRIRPDSLLRGKSLDLKNSESPNFYAWMKAVRKYYYHVQAALYTDVLGLSEFWWVVVGNKKPHRVALYRCPPKWIGLGRRLYSAGLKLIAANPHQRPRAWWEERPLALDDPSEHDDREVQIHEDYVERLIARAS